MNKTQIADRVRVVKCQGIFRQFFLGAEALKQKRTRILCFDSRGNGEGQERNP
ncbi:hypothetical protein QUB08_10305 [Microcoleus sp. BR0-C5]|uniref:hypothetical protein n=1 Tax=Microcoleus sp. BR0-C5 TaxID=2818713 RepID=UPI002FCED741